MTSSSDRNPRRKPRTAPAPGAVAPTPQVALGLAPFALRSLWILGRFIESLAWAALVAIVMWPPYRLFARCIGSTASSSLAALPSTALIAAFVFGPLVFAFGALFA